jgi:hypothetical protein
MDMEDIAATVCDRHRRRVSVGISIITAFCIIENSSLVYPAIPATRSIPSYNNIHRNGISLLVALMMSQDDDHDSSSSSLGVSTTVVSPSERSQRKAAQRDRNKVRSTQTQVNNNKATSQHPDAILKRNRQKKDQQQQQQNRRKHNYAERSNFLQQNETILNDGENQSIITYDFTTTSSVETTVRVRPLHSMAVTKLDKMSTTEDVVKAIKRAQNYHDMHDIREIATFLLEEVGEYTNFLHMRSYNIHISLHHNMYTKCKLTLLTFHIKTQPNIV